MTRYFKMDINVIVFNYKSIISMEAYPIRRRRFRLKELFVVFFIFFDYEKLSLPHKRELIIYKIVACNIPLT